MYPPQIHHPPPYMTTRPPRSTPFPYTTLFRSQTRDERVRRDPGGDTGRRRRDGRRPQPAGERRLPQVVLLELRRRRPVSPPGSRSEEHTSELQSRGQLVCRLLLEKKKAHKTVM